MNLYIIFLILSMATLGSSKATLRSINVVNFGAVGDGRTDDFQAFMKAWAAVCESKEEAVLVVPARKTFLLKPVKFIGPCKSPNIHFWIQGNIVAPRKISDWTTPYMGSWIVFASVNGLSVLGNGQIDGQGYDWWKCALSNGCPRPMGLKFHQCKNLKVGGFRVINSPSRFLSITHSENVIISSLTIINPDTSPNTDGMDLSHSTNIHVINCYISTGDDCIAILSGCSFINITGVSCIKGHGISIGSLGHNGDYDTVEQVQVKHCTFGSSSNGARIKTWQGGSGFVRNVWFDDIILSNTSNPITIDQYYCPRGGCTIQSKAVKISDVKFTGFRGTSFTETAINIACSKSVSCSNIIVDHINITPSGPSTLLTSKCINAHGRSSGSVPAVKCLTQ